VTFGTLTLIAAAGLVGPLLGSLRRSSLPLVVGEIAAGAAIGHSGFRLIDPTDPVLVFLSQIGFAMLMFVVGTHLPLREPTLRPALRRAAAATAVAFASATAISLVLTRVTTLHQTGMIVLLLASSSAAVAMPIVQERGLTGPVVVAAGAWIAVADIMTILAIPLVVSSGSPVRVVIGGIVVTATAIGIWLAASRTRQLPWVHTLRKQSKHQGWALDLRMSLIALFALAWIATRFGTGVLVAGFSAGAVLAVVGEPKRLAQQLLGLAEGFFVPLFFVSLGAKLDVRHLAQSRSDLWLAAALAAAAVACHLAAAVVARLPAATGLLASAQLGVPSAIAALGLSRGELDSGQAAAVIAAALVSLAACAVGAGLLARAAESAENEIRRPG
jgi:Kef-type K+ transport system membrane component KefB